MNYKLSTDIVTTLGEMCEGIIEAMNSRGIQCTGMLFKICLLEILNKFNYHVEIDDPINDMYSYSSKLTNGVLDGLYK